VIDQIQDLRKLRENSTEVVRGKSFTDDKSLIPFFKCVVFVVFWAIVWSIYKKDFSEAGTGALLGLVLYSIIPLASWIWFSVSHLRPAPPLFFKKFGGLQTYASLFLVSWIATYGFNHNYVQLAGYFGDKSDPLIPINVPRDYKHKVSKFEKIILKEEKADEKKYEETQMPLQSDSLWVGMWIFMSIIIGQPIYLLEKYRAKKMKQRERDEFVASEKKKNPFKLWPGVSTGKLAEAEHGAGIAAKQNISLSTEDAAQNIIVFGGIGSGKTSRAINPLLLQLMDQECGGFIFDIKGNFWESVISFSKQTERNVITLGPNHQKINLLSNLTPEIASSFLKSIFLLNSKGGNDSFWIDTATELCRNTLGVLSFFDKKYTLKGLYSYLFDENYRKETDHQIKEIIPTLDDSQGELMAAYARYHSRIFERFDDKVQANVNATVALVLSPFTHPTLMEAFCSVTPKNDNENSVSQATLSSTLDGDIYLVSLPLSVWGLAGKVVYSFIKLSFYNIMQQRNLQKSWNQDRPVFFMCDEFQEIVSANRDGLSDLNFWDKSRSSKTIGIISAQAVSSFYAAIGDRDVSHALLQNFRQKICFRTEDTVTLNYFNSLADKVEVERKTTSKTVGRDSSSETTTKMLVEKHVLNPQLFRNLRREHAVAVLSINGHSMDDVLVTKYVAVE
jgi:type IV secretory pathway TraG/TraD family ATPase VirD4